MWGFIKTVGSLLIGGTGASKGADNVMKIASGVGGWIDGQQFTDQERAEFNAKMIGHYNDFMQSTVNENTQRSITRREIAMWIIRIEILCLMLYGALASFGLAAAKVWWQIAVDSPLGLLTLGVGAFFFGTHMLRSSKLASGK